MNWKKIALFLGIAFGISWITAVSIYLLGIKFGEIASVVLVACFYMPAPAISTYIVQKYIYKEDFETIGWTWNTIKWKWVIGSIVVAIYFILGTLGVVYIAGNLLSVQSFGTIDFSEEGIIQKIVEIASASGQNLEIDLESQLENLPIKFSGILLLSITFVSAIFASFTVNLPFMFGEEFGWRGLLLKETQQLGFVKSNLFIGVFWGLWHAPIILMGHNYPEYPVFGVGMMTLFCVILSFPFAYSRLKSKSILGPCILHGMINGTAAATLYFTWGGHSLVTGITGLAGFIVITISAIAIFVTDPTFVRNYKEL